MRLLLLDNYDSFTYNLLHLVEKVAGIRPEVRLNDQITLEEVDAFDRIILSPGPGLPSDAGIMPALLTRYHTHKSIFGVCLGMQAIGECFGASLSNLPTVYHGVASNIHILQPEPVFNGCPPTFKAGRYHSWVISDQGLPEGIVVTSRDDEENIMSIRHKEFDVRGVQFHPESILSEFGETMIKNWLELNIANLQP